jgi:hypothetical protein
VLTKNRTDLVVDERLTPATGTAEREAALGMLSDLHGEAHKTVGADKACDIKPFVANWWQIHVTPRVAQNTNRESLASMAAPRVTPDYRLSQLAKKLIKTVFRGTKQHGILLRAKSRRLI